MEYVNVLVCYVELTCVLVSECVNASGNNVDRLIDYGLLHIQLTTLVGLISVSDDLDLGLKLSTWWTIIAF